MKKRTPKQRIEDRRKRFRLWLVKVGVYIAILAGVISQNIIQRFDPHALVIDIQVDGWDASRLFVALLVSTAVYIRMNGKGELDGKAKNAERVLASGFTAGFTLMGFAGIGG